MKKVKIILFSLITFVMLFMVSCTDSTTTGDNMSETEAIHITVDYATDEILSEYHSFVEEYVGYDVKNIIFSINKMAKDFKFIEVGYKEENSDVKYFESTVLYSLNELLPEKPFVATWMEQGLIPHRGISFIDEDGKKRFFYIAKSGEDDSLFLVEF